jgi:hypothetical protein
LYAPHSHRSVVHENQHSQPTQTTGNVHRGCHWTLGLCREGGASSPSSAGSPQRLISLKSSPSPVHTPLYYSKARERSSHCGWSMVVGDLLVDVHRTTAEPVHS